MPSAHRRRNSARFELRLDAVARVEIRSKTRVDRGQVRDAAPDLPQDCQRRAVAFIQRRVCFLTKPLDTFGVRQDLADSAQVDVLLSRSECRAIELGELERHELLPGIPFGNRASGSTQFLPARAPSLEEAGHLFGQATKSAEVVNDVQMRGRIEQGVVFVLSVKFDEASREVLQGAGGRQFPVDVRPAPPLGGDLATNEQFFAARLEDGLDRRDLFAGTNEVAGRASAQQEPDGLDQDGLACPGLARQNIEAGLEFNLRRVDHGQAFDAQKAKHGAKGGEVQS
jgi:hypothetical protein